MYRQYQTWEEPTNAVVIRTVGIGGAGVNTLNHLIEAGVSGMDFIAMNTDNQNLRESYALNRLSLGQEITNGMGTGGDPIKGKAAAEASETDIANYIEGANLVFITAGLGGGTGTGAAPVVARIAKAQGALTIGIVTLPFEFEGTYRQNLANNGLAILQKEIDALIVVPNDKLKDHVPQNARIQDAFRPGTDLLRRSISSISQIIHTHGEMNLDFADLCTVAADSGRATLVVGSGTGEDRVKKALTEVAHNLTTDQTLVNASRMMVNITARSSVSFTEAHMIMSEVKQLASPDVNLHTGLIVADEATNDLIITVLATGFSAEAVPATVIQQDGASRTFNQSIRSDAMMFNRGDQSRSSETALLERLRDMPVIQPVPTSLAADNDRLPDFIKGRTEQVVADGGGGQVKVGETAVIPPTQPTPETKTDTRRIKIFADSNSMPEFLVNR